MYLRQIVIRTPTGRAVNHFTIAVTNVVVRCARTPPNPAESHPLGRWPANVIHDGSEEVIAHFPPASKPGKQPKADRAGEASAGTRYTNSGGTNLAAKPGVRRAATGDVSRFFYTAKPSKAERGEGNDHPTVKPIALMRYLCRLVTPPGGVVLDPFAGSGTTLLAAKEEGFRAIGIEREQHYIDIINQRLK